ncbi:electron transfer flavodomain protein [Burkholderia gladioli]|uniref:Electron transfer flavoprotein subunit alpha n=1 Tax=Burkholderia gladioli TaxID=28095 RepID=A0A095F259_BURGA|nr:electron transfer flavoprotein subunit alpha/FixB family protein [Burkholderia gladioli]AJX00781.1 electron transfer flavodomain protein [Burkholderia gladioli]ASD79888.1 electron transfer flavoprotein subunit alpha [Burkholderia gladioli pv. gladioli]AWY54869.1 electron transfer flavoprotein subunit alpha [Burkholderia gladioli pv. gladioli]KGC11438.1 electron transfer flavodomain protein [Burkholderia gladioli]PEH37879.1 electron transfer flavoprotein subunit alpha/FixB family protein [Bu
MSILVIADVLGDTLLPSTFNTVTAAREIASHTDTEIHLLLAGEQSNDLAKSAFQLPVTKVLTATFASLSDRNAESVAKTVLAVARNGYTHVLFSASSFGKSVAPRVAAKLDVAQLSDITAVKGPSTFERPTYAGNVIATVEALDGVKVITVRSTAFHAAQDPGNEAAVVSIEAVTDERGARITGRHSEVSDRPDLASAKIIVSGGRGLGSKENYDRVLTPLADKLGAALGASRAAVDAGFAPNDHQVGQTGKVVAPDVYVAIGLSGAIQHLAGMRDSKIIVAVNSDPDAPIFGVADYGLVADLFAAIPQWLEAQ